MKWVLEKFGEGKKEVEERERDKVGEEKGEEKGEEEEEEEEGKRETKKVVVMMEGKGRMYYRMELKYIPSDLSSKAVDYGFSISRTYEGVDSLEDVWQDKEIEDKEEEEEEEEEEKGKGKEEEKKEKEKKKRVWHVKVGSRVRVILKIVVRDVRYHVAVIDKLPAGLEGINPEIAGQMGYIPKRGGEEELWAEPWEHRNMRDERVEGFAMHLYTGSYGMSYLARATSKGVFVVPPAKVEEMYSPEVFGRTKSEIFVVE